ncbi:TPR domain protein [Phenylobacterium zucineum HLK1]|uniref:TPR domain protein n=1 Tax=Phenylobacterium zucineum (strain HLK1) TaxID=450851 RepID=B4R9A2_PHEZH|nr:tetratricopeptide repeat protein [Phenylobacterium zucineum]ACG77772.1 TPR domain protein [Phenylobacterium zucineum HLK1]
MRHRLLAFAAPLVLLGACATTPPADDLPGVPTAAADTAYGMFLAGNAALNEGRSDEAARFLEMARARSGDEAAVAERAFTAALLAGDIDKAAELAPDGPAASEPARRMGRLVQAVEAIADGKGRLAYEQLSGEAIGFPHRGAAALLAPWAAAQAGDVEASLVRPQVRGDLSVDFFGQLGQAYLFERARRFDEAETDFKAVTAGETPSELTVLAYGGFLERRGRRAEAVKLYDAALQRTPGSLQLQAARERAAAGRSAPAAPTVKEGAALAMLAPAATMIAARQGQIGLAYLRLALRLDPGRNDAWLMVGDFLQSGGDVEGARAAYARPKPGSPEYGAAQAKLAWSYQSEDRTETALKLARAAAATGDPDARLTLSDLLRANGEYAESVQLLGELIAESATPDWRLYYARGAALAQMDRWKDAEADLQAALKLRPDEPELLNFLGYSWIDRGERLEEAMAMVEKAVASNPRSGAMIDSLGWAHYRMGDYKAAVEKLEQAVELEAGDPEINNHLGDAYWMAGRKDEAVFQWRRVLTLKPDAKIQADAEAKLASGLGPQAPKLAGQ